jgi:signal transduction histidine kinase
MRLEVGFFEYSYIIALKVGIKQEAGKMTQQDFLMGLKLSEEHYEKDLDQLEVERRRELGRSLARSVAVFMTIGAAFTLGVWFFERQYVQFLYMGLSLLLPALAGYTAPYFDAKGKIQTWSIIFFLLATFVVIIMAILTPDAIVAMGIAYVLVYLLGGMFLGSQTVLWLALLCIPGIIGGMLIGHNLEDLWFVSLDHLNASIVSLGLAGLLMTVTGGIVYTIMNGQEKIYRQAQRAKMESEKDKAIAENANQAKSHLLAKVSHELRTPLGGVLGSAELLRDNVFGDLNDEQRQMAVDIIDNANFLSTMVSELLNEAQAAAKAIVLRRDVVLLTKFLQQAVTGVDVQARNHGLAFVTSISNDLPSTIYGDEHRLRQVLLNLVGNAIKFTKTGEVSVSLSLHDSAHWLIQVSDTGVGIPKEAQSYIFESFRQVDNALLNENRGIGLGLSIALQLVQLMGGKIELESEVGRGSVFSVILPLETQ